MKDIQYGGTNHYSHSLDNDFREAAGVLKRLSNYLYNLEYLDLEGCADWLQALLWGNDSWNIQWIKMKSIIVRCGYSLEEESELWEVERFSRDFRNMFHLQNYIAKVRKGKWIDIVGDAREDYGGLWRDGAGENEKKRSLMDGLTSKWWIHEFNVILGEPPLQDVERRRMWEL